MPKSSTVNKGTGTASLFVWALIVVTFKAVKYTLIP